MIILFFYWKQTKRRLPFTSSGARPKANTKAKRNTCAYKAGISSFAFLVLLKCLVVFRSGKIKAKRYIMIFLWYVYLKYLSALKFSTNIQNFYDMYFLFAYKNLWIYKFLSCCKSTMCIGQTTTTFSIFSFFLSEAKVLCTLDKLRPP